MESQVNEAGVNDDMEIVVKCEKHVIDEVTATSVCNEVPTQKSQQDVIVDCSPNSEEEDENSMLLEIESSKSQASEAGEGCVLQLESNHENEDVIVEQENKTDHHETIENAAKSCTPHCTISTPGENVTSDQLQNTVEFVQLLEADCIPPKENPISKQLTQEIQVPPLQVAEACEKKALAHEGTLDAVKDKESRCLEKILTKNLSELSVSEEFNGAETTKENPHDDKISVEESDAVVLETTASIQEVNVENIANSNLEPVDEDPISRRFTLLKKRVDRSLTLCSKSLVEDFLSVKKFFEEIDQQETLLQEMASQADLLKSILESAEQLPEELKVSVLDHLEALFNVGHWLEKSVKTKQLAECRQLLNKVYVSLRYSGISKVKTIIEQHSQSTSKSPMLELSREDVQEASFDPFLVTVTHIVDPGEFYIVRFCDKARLDRILSELRDNASSYPTPSEITPGIVYTVCNSCLNWFRGSCGQQCGSQVIGDHPPEILYEFFMIDQGHHEKIPASSIRILPQELSNYPPFAHECTLNQNFQGAPWSIQATTLFKQMTRQSLMNMKVFSQHGGVLEVDLAQLISFGEGANIVSVRDALFFSHRPSSTEPPKKKFKHKFAVEELDHSKQFSVIVTAAESPSNIYFQVADEQCTEYRQMKQELQTEMENASTPLSFSQIQKGCICAAKYRGLWYRCMIEDVHQHNRVFIFYVDTGHRQRENCSDCFNLPERFFHLPAQAIRCELDGINFKNPLAPMVNKNQMVEWSRESIEMVRSYRGLPGDVIVEHWMYGDVGCLDHELTACVVLYKDGENSSLNFCLSRNDYVATNKNQSHPEHATIRSSLAAQRRISQSTSINSVGSGSCVPSTDVSIASPIPSEMSTLSQPLICTSDPISADPISIETDVQVSRGEKKGQRDFYQHEDGESTQSANAPSCSFDHLSSTVVGDPLSAGNVTELLPSVNSATDAQESIACDVSSPTQLPVSASVAKTILVNEAANGSNIEAPDCIPNPWNHYEFQFGKASTSESRKNDKSVNTPMDKPLLEDFRRVSNPGVGPLAQDTLTDLTSKMTLQSSAIHPTILAATSNQWDNKNANKTDPNHDGASSLVVDIMSTQGTQIDCETSMKVSFCWINSPDAIFFRTEDMQRQFQDLRYNMKKHYGSEKRSQEKFDVGFRCAVKADRSWWRAEVLGVEESSFKVSFVDTGYQRTVKARDIYPLINEFDEIKRLMLMCSLCDVYSGTSDGKWKDETINYIRHRLMGSEVIHILKRGPESKCSPLPIMCLYEYDVEAGLLQISGVTRINLNEELVKMGLAFHCSKPLLIPKHVDPSSSPSNQIPSTKSTPSKEPVDPFTAYTPMKLHKTVRTTLPTSPEAIGAKRKRFPAQDWVPRTTGHSGPSDLPYGSDHHRLTLVKSVQSSAKSAFRASPVPSQSPVYVPPPPALYEGQENRFRTKVVVSHLNSIGEFYIQIDKAQETYVNLTQQLDVHFANSSLLLEQLNQADMKTIGLICAANVDGHWNRCRIVDIVDDKTVTLYLTDVGKKTKVNCTQLYRLSHPLWMETPALALECRLWGVRPAGHVTKWSGSATDQMREAIDKCSALFVQLYFVQEELDDTGLFQSVHYVRFYHEYIKRGGPLEFDQTLTGCLNDELLDQGLALRDPMLVTLQPSPKRWLPSVTLPPELERARPIWMDDDGLLYFHRPEGPTNHVSVINKLINWHYEKSTPTPADLAHWVKDEPCIALYTDTKWYRAVVLTADDEATSAIVLFVDYGNSEKVSYENMRKSLLCYEYPIQASRCRLSRYPGPEMKPTVDELDKLLQVLVDKEITVRVLEPATSGSDPVVDIWFPDEGAEDLKDIFQQFRPEYRYSGTRSKASGSPVELSPRGPGTPAPTVPLSTVDLDDSIFDANSCEFSDDVYPIFNFEVFHESREMDVYRPLFIPRRFLLPIRIVSFDYDQCQGVFSPQRLSLGDSPHQWQEQVEGYASLSEELQRAAPLFPDLDVVEYGSPCTCRYPENGKESRWQRGKVLGYDDDNLEYLRIELVDMGMNVKLRKYNIKHLATEYLALPRHSAKAKLVYAVPSSHPPDMDFIHSYQRKLNTFSKFEASNCFFCYFTEVNEPLQMKLFIKNWQGHIIPAIE